MQVGEGLASRRLIVAIGALFAAKAIALFAFSCYEVAHGALSFDFAIFFQAWTLIARGELNPYSTIIGQPFWKDHVATAMWPLAIGGLVTRSPLFLKAVQDIASASADFIGALWTLDILRSANVRPRTAWALLIAALASLVLNPWTFYGDAFDFHFHTIAALLLMASLWSFYKGKRLTGVLCALGMCSGGDASATYAFGVGISVALAERRLWKEGLFVAVASLAIVVAMHAIGGGTGSGLSGGYGYLTSTGAGPQTSVLSIISSIVRNPSVVLGVLWRDRLHVYANLGPDAWIGFFSPWAIGPWSVMLLVNGLHQSFHGAPSQVSLPGFQFSTGYALLAPSTTFVILWLERRLRNERFMLAAAMLVTANAIGWAIAWLPAMPARWVRTPVDLANEIDRVDRSTPDDVQVLASDGIVGDVAARSFVEQFLGRFDYQLYSRRLRIILTPYSGIQVTTIEEDADTIAQLLDSGRSEIVRTSNTIWVFDYRPGDREASIRLGNPRATLPAVAFPTDVGRRVFGNDAAHSYLEVDGKAPAGFLLRNAYFLRPPGEYDVSVLLQARDPIAIEVRDASKNLLLARRIFRSTSPQEVNIPVVFPYSGGEPLYGGFGPFVSPAWRSTSDDALEIRIWAPARAHAQVRAVAASGTGPQIR